MKHAREDYRTRILDTENKIGFDEPVFLLRGQDKCFVPMLQMYLWMTSITTQDVEIIKSLYTHIAYSEAWQAANQDKVKFADMPKGLDNQYQIPLACGNCGREFQEFEELKYHLVECGGEPTGVVDAEFMGDTPSSQVENEEGVDARFADGSD